MSKKTKSRALTIGFLVLLVGGYLIYKYAYLVYQSYDYYTHYDDVHGLQRSSPVFINGVRVGEVSGLDMNEKGGVEVEFSIDKEIPIPKGTIALLASLNLMGEKKITLVPGDEGGYYTHNDFITGKYDTTVLEMKDQIDPFVESAKYYLLSADKKFTKMKISFDNGMTVKLQNDIYQLERKTDNLYRKSYQLSSRASEVIASLKKLNATTAKMAVNNAQLNNSINSIENSTYKLTQVEYSVKAKEVSKLAKEIESGAKAVEENENLNKLLNDKSAYNDANELVEKVNNGVKDLSENPQGISIF